MAIYIGINGVPKEITEVYISANGIPKEVKEIYVGDSGLVRQVYGGGGPMNLVNLFLQHLRLLLCLNVLEVLMYFVAVVVVVDMFHRLLPVVLELLLVELLILAVAVPHPQLRMLYTHIPLRYLRHPTIVVMEGS